MKKFAGMLLVVIGAALLSLAVGALTSGCATTGTARPVSMGCEDPLAADCDDPTAYPPLTAMLPPWPFPKLLVPIEDVPNLERNHR